MLDPNKLTARKMMVMLYTTANTNALPAKATTVTKSLTITSDDASSGKSFFYYDGPGKAAALNRQSLGSQTMEGVLAQGTSSTATIPAGSVGNDRDIQVVDERWYSPELKTTLMTKHSDPRSGEEVFRLTNISRSEPSPALFQVPAGYQVVETGIQTKTIKRD
jgi:hypothetical protein